MLPIRQKKVDLTGFTEEERKLFRLYGKLPTGKDVLNRSLKERKYFDSGDYALSKAGKPQGPVGSQHPSPEKIPHIQAHSSSPVKESLLVHEAEIAENAAAAADGEPMTDETVTTGGSVPQNQSELVDETKTTEESASVDETVTSGTTTVINQIS